MCRASLQGADCSRQVHQLTQGTDGGCGLPTVFNVTDITNSLAEPHVKAPRWLIGELLKVNTINWQNFPPQIRDLRRIQFFHNKKKGTELLCFG